MALFYFEDAFGNYHSSDEVGPFYVSTDSGKIVLSDTVFTFRDAYGVSVLSNSSSLHIEDSSGVIVDSKGMVPHILDTFGNMAISVPGLIKLRHGYIPTVSAAVFVGSISWDVSVTWDTGILWS